MAVTDPNKDGMWEIQGTSTTIAVLLADQFSNPPPAGTVVNFRAESGQITPTCSTDANGACTVTWTTQAANNNPPLPYDGTTSAGAVCYNNPTSLGNLNNKNQGCVNKAGRVTIMAWVTGSEGFIDNNNNGTFDDGDALATTPANYANPPVSLSDYFYFDRRDLEPPYLDANFDYAKEVGTANSGIPNEFEVPNAQQTASDYTGKYNGVLCQRTDNMCSSVKSIYLFRNMEMLMPRRDNLMTSFWNNAGTATINSIGSAGGYQALVQDANGNTMADGTTVSVETYLDTNSTILLDTSLITIAKENGYGTTITFNVARATAATPASGNVRIVVTEANGNIVHSAPIPVAF
jgi:hypothetical protein